MLGTLQVDGLPLREFQTVNHFSHRIREYVGGWVCVACGEDLEALEQPCKADEILSLDLSGDILYVLERLAQDDPVTRKCRARLGLCNSEIYRRQVTALRRFLRVQMIKQFFPKE